MNDDDYLDRQLADDDDHLERQLADGEATLKQMREMREKEQHREDSPRPARGVTSPLHPGFSSSPMSRVIIESPYAGDRARNEAYLRAAVRDCLGRGEAPLASHGFYTQYLDEDVASEA